MVRGIIVYFLLVVCLLTKDGISLDLDVLREKSDISLEMSFEDSLEEDGSDDFFAGDDVILALNQQSTYFFVSNSVCDQYQSTRLNVLLEQVSPPPRTA